MTQIRAKQPPAVALTLQKGFIIRTCAKHRRPPKKGVNKIWVSSVENEIHLLKFGFILSPKVLLQQDVVIGWNYFILA